MRKPLVIALLAASVLATCSTLRAQNPLTRTKEVARPFAGAFQGTGIALELAYDGAKAAYAGWLTFQAKRYPCTADAEETRLAGRFAVDGEQFTFTATLDGERLSLLSDGSTFELTRRAAAAPPTTTSGTDPGAPVKAVAGLPAWLVPGVRVTFLQTSATIAGVRSHLVEDENGVWVDPATGRRFDDQTTQGSGGAGYEQFNFVHVGDDAIVVDVRAFLISDVQSGECQPTTATAYVGNRDALGDYWIHPARLAAMQPTNAQGVRIARNRYPLDGREYDALTVQTTTASSYSRYTYDLQTGLCLVGSTSGTAAPVATVDPTGRVSPGQGMTSRTQTRLVGIRNVRLPWADDSVPRGLAVGTTLDFTGNHVTQIPGVQATPFGFDLRIQITRAASDHMLAKVSTRMGVYGMAPQENTSERAYGASTTHGLFVSPDVLQGLSPNQVLDEDPVTRIKTFFSLFEGMGVINEQGPRSLAQSAYDMKSGRLTGLSIQLRQGIGTQHVTVRAVGR